MWLRKKIFTKKNHLDSENLLIYLNIKQQITKLQEPNDHHHDEDQTFDQWFETDDFANIRDSFLCLSDLVDAPEVQKPNDEDQSCDQWINGSNDLASIEETVSSLINPSPFAETPQSEPPGLRYDTGCADSNLEQFARDLEDQQQRMQQKFQRGQQPQHLINQNSMKMKKVGEDKISYILGPIGDHILGKE
uniref:F10A2.4 protein n=1 Tax=Arabidopsis thaliana TaxID=3702 RepID=Q9S9Y7_ARATH|nr:contains similarity to a Arabidopsis thaliana hypothetical protein (GB:AF058825) [Arabidopsis thaliana]